MTPDGAVTFSLLGFFVSILIGLTGMGGGALTTPILIFLGIPPTIAVGSDLAFTTATRALGSYFHSRRSSIDFYLVKLILLGSLPSTVAAYLMMPFLEGALGVQGLNSLLTQLLASLLVIASGIGISRALMHRRAVAVESNVRLEEEGGVSLVAANRVSDNTSGISMEGKLSVVGAGALVGFAVQLTSVGSGTILIFFLMFFLKSKKIVGTDLLHAFILTSFSAILHFGLGDVNLGIVAALIAGGIPGILLGVKLFSFVSVPRLHQILNVVIMGAGLTLIIHLIA